MNEQLATIPVALGQLAQGINNASDGVGDLACTVSMALGLGVPDLPANGRDVPSALAGYVETILATAAVFDRAAGVMRDMICRPVERPVQIPATATRDLDAEGPDARLPAELPADAERVLAEAENLPWKLRSRMVALTPEESETVASPEADEPGREWTREEMDEAVPIPLPTPEPAPVDDADTPGVRYRHDDGEPLRMPHGA